MSNDQTRAPVYEALEKLRRKRVVPLMFRVIKEEGAILN